MIMKRLAQAGARSRRGAAGVAVIFSGITDCSTGASGWTTLRTVTLPLLRIPPLGAAALVFVTAAGSFAVPRCSAPAGFSTMPTRAGRRPGQLSGGEQQ